ncbi:hypothetical protein ABVT39_012468, partial [Epinephelus coioides]
SKGEPSDTPLVMEEADSPPVQPVQSVYHSMYLKYLPKRAHFGYDVMIHASMLAALDHNNNANRKQ